MAKLPTTLGGRKTASTQRRIHSVDMTQTSRQAGKSAQQIINAGADLSDLAVMRQKEDEELKRNRTRHIKNEARRKLDEYTIGTDDTEGLFSRVGANGVAIEKDFDDRFTQIREQAMKDAGEGRFSEALSLELDDLNTSYRSRVLSHQSKQRTDYGAMVASANTTSAMNDIGHFYNDDAAVGKNLQVVEASLKVMGKAQGWDEATMQNRLREGRSEAYTTQINSMIATDDPYLIQQAHQKYKSHEESGNLTLEHRARMDKYFDTAMPVVTAKVEFGKMATSAPSDFKEVASFVITALEGDDKVHIDNDGGITKFGINQNHNPDLMVATLTRAQAKGRAKTNYWDKVNADDLPDNMKLIAFDASFNHGPGKANKMIKQANGDPHKLLALRKKEYQRLKAVGEKSLREGKGDPKNYVGNYKGWINRLGKLEAKLGGKSTEIDGDALYQRAKELDIETPGAGQELIGLYESQIASREKAEKSQATALKQGAREKLQEFDGDYTKFTTKERANFEAAGIDVTTIHKDFSEPSAMTELTLMDGNTLLNTDIDEAFGDRLKFADLNKWKEKQESLKDPANKHIEDQIDGVVSRYFFDAGLDPKATGKKSNKQYVANMKGFIQSSLVKLRADGKEITPKMLNSIAGDFILTNKNSLNKGFFNAFNGDKDALKFDYTDIPKKKRDQLRNSLLELGEPATDEQILNYYVRGMALANK